jgi:hypothetical protein
VNSAQPRVSRLGRFLRGRRPDHNPLRRASDRIETLVLALLVVAFLAGAPFAAKAAGAAEYAIAHRIQLEQEAATRLVTAVLLQATPAAQGENWGYQEVAQARWTAPDGKVVQGPVLAEPGAPAGTKAGIWVTLNGQVANPPLQDSQVTGAAVLCEIAGAGALAVLLAVAGMLGRHTLDKRRMAAWDADWRSTGPHWTPRA